MDFLNKWDQDPEPGESVSRGLIIDNKRINDDSDCYVIAEVGHNHQGSVETAKELFKAAKECGADAVKLQKRDNRSLYTRQMYDKPYENENSYGATYGAHREALEFEWDEYFELSRYAKELGITFFATAFDFKSADFLEKLNVPAYKIASGDLKNIPLIKYVAQFKKPLVISTGAGDMNDVQRVYDALMPINPHFTLLQCTCTYPAKFEELDLNVITTFRKKFPNTVIGLSSHDNGIAMAVAGYVLGARVVEKHFTLNRTMKGTDHVFSLEPVGLRKMVRDLKRTRMALGDGIKKIHTPEQSAYLKMGKKLVAARDLPVGHVLKKEDILIKSPGDGLPPYELDNIVGKTLAKSLKADDSVTFEVCAGRPVYDAV